MYNTDDWKITEVSADRITITHLSQSISIYLSSDETKEMNMVKIVNLIMERIDRAERRRKNEIAVALANQILGK